jgi:hypothetical protein
MSDARTKNRWWEYYFLRYFVGTVVGAVAIVFLLNFPGSFWYDPEFLTIRQIGNLGVKEITGLAALGFAFCYIASAPMLLMHATRAQLSLDPLRVRWRFWIPMAGAIVFLFCVVPHFLSISRISYQGLGLFMFLCVVGFQMATLIESYFDGFKLLGRSIGKSLRRVRLTHRRLLSMSSHIAISGNTAMPSLCLFWSRYSHSFFIHHLSLSRQSLPWSLCRI